MEPNLENQIVILEEAEKVVVPNIITVVQDTKQAHIKQIVIQNIQIILANDLDQIVLQNVFKMGYKAVLDAVIWRKLHLTELIIIISREDLFLVAVSVEVDVICRVMAGVADTLVAMDRPIGIILLVEEDHSISIQMEQNHLDGSNTENVKLNL